MDSLKYNGQRAKYAILMIWIVLGLELVSLWSSYLQYDLLQSITNGAELSAIAADANDNRQILIGVLYMIAFIISAITFIQWFRRAYYNLQSRVTLSTTDEWAAGSWFVPVYNLYKPYQMMVELYRETKKLLLEKELIRTSALGTGILGVWWTLWIINNIGGNISFRLYLRADTLEEIRTSTIIDMAVSFIGIPLALVAIKVIKNYANIEETLYDYLYRLPDEPASPSGSSESLEPAPVVPA
jgi:hypothetical protein